MVVQSYQGGTFSQRMAWQHSSGGTAHSSGGGGGSYHHFRKSQIRNMTRQGQRPLAKWRKSLDNMIRHG